MLSFFSTKQASASSPAADADEATLNRARFEALSRQIPILYSILIINTVALAYTHVTLAPKSLALYAPALLCLACAVRLALWWRSRNLAMSDARIAIRLKSTVVLSGVLGCLFTGWSIALFPYGGVAEQSHVAFYTSITVMGCYLCLTHLPAASLTLFVTCIIPFTLFFGMSDRTAFVAIALNMFLASIPMAFVLFRYYGDFVDLVKAQQRLISRQAETQRLSDDNFRLASLDGLTGLPNRRRFLADLESMLSGAQSQNKRLAIGLIDLDGFKPVNDVYGHLHGDKLLVMVAERLLPLCGASTILARLGGDEFGLIMADVVSDQAVLELGQALTKALRAPFETPDIRVQISGSIGFAVYPQAGDTSEILFERADYALYHAKETQRGTVVLFSEEHEIKIREASVIAQHLRSADLEKELWVAFQPITETVSGKTIGFEALARWRSPALGDISPDIFIRLAERHHMVNELTRVLLGKTLRTVAEWPDHLRVSFNLSTFDLASPEAMARIVGMLKDNAARVDRVDFEITETAVFVDFEQARKSILALKEFNARISLDDFGSGYSSLAYVQKLPLDRIKIDRGFVTDIETDQASRNIVKTIVDLCRNLGLACVAEGVETNQQLQVLQSLGCTVVQGYLFGRPMANERIPGFLLNETLRNSEQETDAPLLRIA